MSDVRGRVRVEHGAKRVRAYLGGHLVADTTRPLLVWESPHYPAYYLPHDDVHARLEPTGTTERSPSRGTADVLDVHFRRDLLIRSERVTCPYKGSTVYYHVRVGDREEADLAWSYPTPLPESRPIAGLICFPAERAEVFVDGERVS